MKTLRKYVTICTGFNYGDFAIIKITNTEDYFMSKITVKDTEINVTKINDEDYICITDMLKGADDIRPYDSNY